MEESIEKLFLERRSLEEALADLLEKYQRTPNPDLVRKIELLREEIEVPRKALRAGSGS